MSLSSDALLGWALHLCALTLPLPYASLLLLTPCQASCLLRFSNLDPFVTRHTTARRTQRRQLPERARDSKRESERRLQSPAMSWLRRKIEEVSRPRDDAAAPTEKVS